MYLASVFNNKFILSSIRLLSALTILTFCFISCKKDDSPINSIPANDYLDQHNIDNDSIIDFMQNHFYNYDDYVNLSPGDGPELIIDSIKGDNSNKTPIYDLSHDQKGSKLTSKTVLDIIEDEELPIYLQNNKEKFGEWFI